MPTAPAGSPRPDAPRRRQRDDACPGALRLHTADDGALARVRIPGGVLTTRQALALGDAARRLGDGDVHLTSRGNVQLRGLDASSGLELAELLDAAGLLPSRRHERVRNIVASPLSGLDGHGHLDVRPWLRALDEMLCGSEEATALSGRFLFALDDGRGDVAALGADITLRAAAADRSWVSIGPETLTVTADDAPGAALLAAEAFVTASGGGAWRMPELPGGAEGLAREVVRQLPTATRSAEAPPRICTSGPTPGVVTGPGGRESLSVLAPLGRLTGEQSEILARLGDELRLTPWRGVVLPGVSAGELPELEAMGLVTGPTSPWLGVGACVGRPGCAKSLADVRTDAAAALEGSGANKLPVYWSGCDRRCGRPRGDHVDVVARTDGYQVAVVRDGRSLATTRAHHPSELAATVAAARTHNQ
ncbi:precorrin-3B synthase [Streptomyces sp. NPDC051172]|uniref:precorrin-3B synthase n=1 Tax=Streptomyces sp. NPDC051172 TaxID=3155796 RepID=UPI003427D4B9